MENQTVVLEQVEFQSVQDGHETKVLSELQLATVGGGCVEYCPY
jgi:hypothetical protein